MSDRADPFGALSPTHRLLCLCARPAGDHPWPAAGDAVDWDGLPALLARHGLGILAPARLAPVRDRMPDATWERIRESAFNARARALAMAAELLRLLQRLAADDIDVLPFKGPVLGLDAYGDVGARPFVDLDLLIRPRDLERARAVLAALGYSSEYRFSPAQDRWFRRVDGDYPMVHAGTDLLVELHVRALSRRFGDGLDTDQLWRRRRTISMSGATIPALGADDQLYLHLVHGAKHRWERLEWVASTAQLLRQRGGDVSALVRAPYAAPRAVLVGCLLAHDLLDAPLDPAAQAATAADPAVPRLADAARRHLFDGTAAGAGEDTAAKLWYNFRVQRGLPARARYLYRWMAWPSPEDWAGPRIPDPLFVLYRAWRPLRLAWRYLRPAGRELRGANG